MLTITVYSVNYRYPDQENFEAFEKLGRIWIPFLLRQAAELKFILALYWSVDKYEKIIYGYSDQRRDI